VKQAYEAENISVSFKCTFHLIRKCVLLLEQSEKQCYRSRNVRYGAFGPHRLTGVVVRESAMFKPF